MICNIIYSHLHHNAQDFESIINETGKGTGDDIAS